MVRMVGCMGQQQTGQALLLPGITVDAGRVKAALCCCACCATLLQPRLHEKGDGQDSGGAAGHARSNKGGAWTQRAGGGPITNSSAELA